MEEYAFTDQLISLMAQYASNPQPVYMILGMEDEVLSSVYTEQMVTAAKLWKISGGHSLSGNQQFYSVFREAVEEIEIQL